MLPCKCGHDQNHHSATYVSFKPNLERYYMHCYMKDNCQKFEEMPNLDYLEWLYTKKRQGEINV